MEEKVFKNIVYIDTRYGVEWEMDYIPDIAADNLDDSECIAYIDSFYFATYEGIDYLVLRFETIDFDFNFMKFYPMNRRVNRELEDMLIKIRAIRLRGGHRVDWNLLLEYKFSFNLVEEDGRYSIQNLHPRMEDYEDDTLIIFDSSFLEDLIKSTYNIMEGVTFRHNKVVSRVTCID